ncbi:MAG: hypothetical protein JSV98_09335 [candidate division WOR-3 bacterium]|nr:MAG: hypothetical protein JSV98_09335 [candidate division WOR-3 bacterium]
MRRSVTCIVLITLLYSQCAPRSYGGYKRIDVPIVITDVIGEIVDAEERSKYDIFKGIDDFEQARFYAIEEGGLCAEIQTAHHTMVSVIREPQMRTMLKQYIEEYEWIQTAKELFERKYDIVDYDMLGFPITRSEVSRFSNLLMNCGCILASAGTVAGIFWLAALGVLWSSIFSPDWEEEEERAENLLVIGAGAGLLAGVLAGLLTGAFDKNKGVNIIRESRMPRVVR